MEFETILVEAVGPKNNETLASSGVLLNKKYALVPFSTISTIIKTSSQKRIGLETVDLSHCRSLGATTSLRLFTSYDKNPIQIDNRNIFATFSYPNCRQTALDNWKFLDVTNYNIDDILTFAVVGLNNHTDIDELKSDLEIWWNLIRDVNLEKGDEICVRSAPFGGPSLIDSYSQGVVSNIVDGVFVFSDCPTAPGSQGSPVYKLDNGLKYPVGLVLSPLCWWRGVWSGMSLIIDAHILLTSLIDSKIHRNHTEYKDRSKLIDTINSSLLQICVKSQWGTAILMNKKCGILITNSHVLESSEKSQIHLHWNGLSLNVDVIFQTPPDSVYDLAVIKCNPCLIDLPGLQDIDICQETPNLGDTVYAAGFALFPEHLRLSPTLTKGHISQKSPSMLRTTCCINPGASGGAILNKDGQLLAVIVCNVRLENGVYFPRFNLSIPVKAFYGIMKEYSESLDSNVLNKLYTTELKELRPWVEFVAKL